MERSEHPIVSECLKSSENVTGVGGETRQFASASLHPDSTSSSFHMSSGNDVILHDKELYAYSHPYINFTGKNSDKDWGEDVTGRHEKERSILGAYRGPGFSDPLASTLRSGIQKDKLRHSKSLISAKSVEIPPKRMLSESISGENSSQNNGNGLLAACSIINKIHDSEFEKDFSLTGAEDNQGVPDTGRVLSSGSSTIVESFLNDNSSVVRGDGRTSAVAEVPTLIRSNSIAPSSAQNDAVSSVTAEPSAMNRLNMAEIFAQVPLRVHTTPTLSVENQSFEELAIKQSRQLIPTTPLMPKTLVSNYVEKSKAKTVARSGDMSSASKIGQVLSSHLPCHSLRFPRRSILCGSTTSDDTKSLSKFLPLKSPSEKISISVAKDFPKSSTVNSPLVGPLATSSLVRSPIKNPKLSTTERRTSFLAVIRGSLAEKKPTTSQAQSRNEFFNLLRNKTSKSHSLNIPDQSPGMASPSLVKSNKSLTKIRTDPVGLQGSNAHSSSPSLNRVTDNTGDITRNDNDCEESLTLSNKLENHSATDPVVCEENLILSKKLENLSAGDEAAYPDEEEAAFLRSLGWEENAGEEEGLTEEEINEFYKEYVKLKPFSKQCDKIRAKLSIPLESYIGNWDSASSGQSSSNSKLKHDFPMP